MFPTTRILLLLIAFGVLLTPVNGQVSDSKELTGSFDISGSGTLYPLTEAVVTLYTKYHPNVSIDLKSTGSSAGLEAFCEGKVPIVNSSRRISIKEEKRAQSNGIQFYEIPVAADGITLIANKENNFLKYLTVNELRLLMKQNSPIRKWSDLRTDWPDEPVVIYGPDSSHGTYDYFVEKILTQQRTFRTDYRAIQDYDDIIEGVAQNRYAIGYAGFDYYYSHKEDIRGIAIDNGDGPVEPSYININRGNYRPLSRTLYIYVSADAAQQPAVEKFVTFYLRSARVLSSKIGFVPFDNDFYREVLASYQNGKTGMVQYSKASSQ